MESNRRPKIESGLLVELLDRSGKVGLRVGEGVLPDRLPSELRMRLGDIFAKSDLFRPEGESLLKKIERLPIAPFVEEGDPFFVERRPGGNRLIRGGGETEPGGEGRETSISIERGEGDTESVAFSSGGSFSFFVGRRR
ncbi:MAG: hypothetical protein MPW17_16155 [Candidatus Manganitrophus sp.]|nr:hypothetical protein [Candidatus Manganitrophus sp.]WDT70280.1 MAG: hypothetical protein MPW17_16155 [Candidatus Manganitrophus sp.]